MSEREAPASSGFQRFAGACAIGVGIGGIAYSIVFVLLVRTGTASLEAVTWGLLLLGGLLTTAVLSALYRRLTGVEPGVALWALLLGTSGALGSIVHAGFDLARLMRPSGKEAERVTAQLPNAIDPYGLLTFAVAGLAIALFGWLIRRDPALPRGLGTLGEIAGVLLILVYLGRFFIFDPSNPALLAIAAIAGVVANPAWFIWLGRTLRRGT